jgi:integrase
MSRGAVEHNPAVGIERQAEKSRDVVLSRKQIRRFWNGLSGSKMSEATCIILKLILTTAQRPGEVCAIEKSELDLENMVWTQPGSKTKNGKAHKVPLSKLAADLISSAWTLSEGSRYLFPSKSMEKCVSSSTADHAVRRNREALGISCGEENEQPPATPHDLRRTAASYMTSLGVHRLHVEQLLNHADSGIGGTYDRHRYFDEKRKAVEIWAIQLRQISGGRVPSENVVAFPGGG